MMLLGLISIGFLTISIWDVLDIIIVGFLLFQIYKLLKGTLGFNIFMGLVSVYGAWWLVAALEMPLLSSILGQFVSVGIMALLIVFQPEVRRFLILLGQGSFRLQRFGFFERLFQRDEHNPKREEYIRDLTAAVSILMAQKTGALILIVHQNQSLEGLYTSGVVMNADLSKALILAIFQKESPLHDGATVLMGGRIVAASCVLPVSESPNIPQQLGLRHRAAVGITEISSATALIVSEETGRLAYAREGRILQDLSTEKLQQILRMVWT